MQCIKKERVLCLSYVSYVVLTTNKVLNVFGIGTCLVLKELREFCPRISSRKFFINS